MHQESTPIHIAKMDVIMAADINNEAMQLEMAGNYVEAEKKFVQALRMKEESDYSTPINIALSQNALAELYLKMGKLDEAQDLLEKAFAVRSGKVPYQVFDGSLIFVKKRSRSRFCCFESCSCRTISTRTRENICYRTIC